MTPLKTHIRNFVPELTLGLWGSKQKEFAGPSMAADLPAEVRDAAMPLQGAKPKVVSWVTFCFQGQI